jgi:hypothetical protein
MKQLMRLLREPLFHFLIIGSLLFVLYSAISGPAPAPVHEIVVTPERVTQLVAGFEKMMRRPPNNQELRTIIDSFIREEVYYREALALGLERDDTIIRRRLQQKMEFFTDTGADLIQAEEGALEAYYQLNLERFQDPATIALAQVYLGQNATQEHVETVLASLQSDSDADPFQWSERTLLPSQMSLSTASELDGVFGAGFFDELMQLPIGQWTGTIESGYGLHFVYIRESTPTRVPPLEEVRGAIEREWRAEKSKELREAVYSRLLERYTVILPDNVAQ